MLIIWKGTSIRVVCNTQWVACQPSEKGFHGGCMQTTMRRSLYSGYTRAYCKGTYMELACNPYVNGKGSTMVVLCNLQGIACKIAEKGLPWGLCGNSTKGKLTWRICAAWKGLCANLSESRACIMLHLVLQWIAFFWTSYSRDYKGLGFWEPGSTRLTKLWVWPSSKTLELLWLYSG